MEIYHSKKKLLLYFFLSLLLLAAAIFVLAKFYQAGHIDNQSVFSEILTIGNVLATLLSLIPLLGIIIFGGIAITFAVRFFDPRPQLIISEEGIDDRRLNFGLLEWKEIESLYFEENKSVKWISLFLFKPENYFFKLPLFQKFLRKANGQFGINFFRIRLEDLDAIPEEVFALIEKYYLESNKNMALSE